MTKKINRITTALLPFKACRFMHKSIPNYHPFRNEVPTTETRSHLLEQNKSKHKDCFFDLSCRCYHSCSCPYCGHSKRARTIEGKNSLRKSREQKCSSSLSNCVVVGFSCLAHHARTLACSYQKQRCRMKHTVKHINFTCKKNVPFQHA